MKSLAEEEKCLGEELGTSQMPGQLRNTLDGWVQKLQVPCDHELTVLQNPDLEPMGSNRRIWGFWSFFGYWGIPNITIWTWSTGSALLGLGLSLGQVMGAVTIGNVIICIYTCLNSNPGLKYHIGYTVVQRMIFGIYGSAIGIIIRILLSIIFYGAQSWLGGLCVVVMLSSLSENFMNLPNTFNDSVNMTTRDFLGFLIFQVLQVGFYLVKPEKMNVGINISCFVTTLAFVSILISCLVKNGGTGSINMHFKNTEEQQGWMWLYAITIWYGALSPTITNQCDYSRFGTGYKRTYLGIIVSIMLTGTFVPLASLLVASATLELYHKPIWLPTDLSLVWLSGDYSSGARAANFFLGLAFTCSQLMFNIVANGFAGGMDLAGILPKYINIKRGAIITAILSWCVQPWNFYNTSSIFMSVMSSFGVITTPIIAISICDFLVVRKSRLPVTELYSTQSDGVFYFTKGINLRSVIVWLISIAPGIPGLINSASPLTNFPELLSNFFYGLAIFSFIIPFGLYYALCLKWPFINPTDEDAGDCSYEIPTPDNKKIGESNHSSTVIEGRVQEWVEIQTNSSKDPLYIP